MIKSEEFLTALQKNNIEFFTGVPDSLLKELCACIDDTFSSDQHVINANEGGAIALAMGYHLATGKTPLVYLQNSGLGNTINPLLSLADKAVYSIPMLLIIGWRGEPGVHDEPQHIKQGAVQNDLLTAMDIPFEIIDAIDSDTYTAKITQLLAIASQESKPVALIVRKGTFSPYTTKNSNTNLENKLPLQREAVLEIILNTIEKDAIVVSTTGKTSREIYEIRKRLHQGNEKDFLTVGGMGHCSQIALGIALQIQNRPVYCIDGDGASIMHLGASAIIGNNAPGNFKHILLNNGAHESVGGQQTVGFDIDFKAIAKACNYKSANTANDTNSLLEKLNTLKETDGPSLLEIQIACGSRSDLGRPTTSTLENKEMFMNWIHP